MNGAALGSLTMRYVSKRVADSERIRSSFSGSTARKPVKLLISTGKNDSNAAMAILLPSPKPNQMTTSGAMATLGRLCSANA